MRRKLMLLGAGAVGYVLGTKAGHGRYEQIMSQAQKLRSNPTVQQKMEGVKQAAKGAAGTATQKMRSKSGGYAGESEPTGSATTYGGTGAAGTSGTAGAGSVTGTAGFDTADDLSMPASPSPSTPPLPGETIPPAGTGSADFGRGDEEP